MPPRICWTNRLQPLRVFQSPNFPARSLSRFGAREIALVDSRFVFRLREKRSPLKFLALIAVRALWACHFFNYRTERGGKSKEPFSKVFASPTFDSVFCFFFPSICRTSICGKTWSSRAKTFSNPPPFMDMPSLLIIASKKVRFGHGWSGLLPKHWAQTRSEKLSWVVLLSYSSRHPGPGAGHIVEDSHFWPGIFVARKLSEQLRQKQDEWKGRRLNLTHEVKLTYIMHKQ